MRLLIVDDARTDLDACRTSAKKWNKSHSSERQIVLIEKKTFQEAQEYFACHESCNVDGVILDLKLGRLPDAGQKLIDALDAMHRLMRRLRDLMPRNELALQKYLVVTGSLISN